MHTKAGCLFINTITYLQSTYYLLDTVVFLTTPLPPTNMTKQFSSIALVGFLISFLFLTSLPTAKAGGPWTKKKGEGYFQASFNFIPAINQLSINPYRVKYLNRKVFDGTAGLYAEYGISDKLTLSASLPLKIVEIGRQIEQVDTLADVRAGFGPPGEILDAGTLVDLGNTYVGVAYSLLNKKWRMAAHLLLMVPTAIQPYNPRTALRTAYPCWGIQPMLSVGTSNKKWYTYLESGVQFRTDAYSHQWVANAEYGFLVGKTYFAVALNAIICFSGGADIPNRQEEVQTGLYVNNQNFVAITLKAIIPITKQIGGLVSLSGGVWANNVQRGPNIGLGVFYKWQQADSSSNS